MFDKVKNRQVAFIKLLFGDYRALFFTTNQWWLCQTPVELLSHLGLPLRQGVYRWAAHTLSPPWRSHCCPLPQSGDTTMCPVWSIHSSVISKQNNSNNNGNDTNVVIKTSTAPIPSPAWCQWADRWGSGLWAAPLMCNGRRGNLDYLLHSLHLNHRSDPPPVPMLPASAADPEAAETAQETRCKDTIEQYVLFEMYMK